MRIARSAAHRAADQFVIETLGIPGVCLMQSAGDALVREMADMLGGIAGRHITMLCGPGNNGGDGFAAARLLHAAGAHPTVLLGTESDRLRGDSAVHFHALAALDIPVVHGPGQALADTDLIVDCLLGTGAQGAPRGAVAALIKATTESSAPLLACDIPSGVDADTGETPGVAIRADRTVTLTALKPGLLLHPGAAHAGRIRVAPLGIPPRALPGPADTLTTARVAANLLPSRTQHRDANKGSFGKVLVVAGSRGMVGAAVLTATSALRAGAGLVWLALPTSCIDTAASLAPEIVLRAVPETPDGRHDGARAAEWIARWARDADALAMGPGLGQGPETTILVRQLLEALDMPTVLDADALTALSPLCDPLRVTHTPLVLTPHPGEMGRLLGTSTVDIQSKRWESVQHAAALSGAVALLKGARTLVAEPNGVVHVNRDGTPGCATAGSGDVLTGVVAALLAAGLPGVDAARAGATLHALAGSLAAPAPFPGGALASEIRDKIPVAWRRLMETTENLDDEPCLM